ncbi:testis-expressed protein 13A [Hippopotamus amphibius kiboko]|uniref:testis-expressed protein 13A n=1 Tax=Hippopotamus amphibius kiboko TaxID=575201 RepID=UPI00259AD881|nr:testis-expressed protein 13A [Hippopotamus amphibius kiboko]
MALNPEDPRSGFLHGTVMAFINEKVASHAKGPEFYLENLSLSWEEVEDKLRAMLEDRQVPNEAKEACAWGSLALGLRFANRQSQLYGNRVQWLRNFAGLHRSAAQALASDLQLLTVQQAMERKEAAFHLRLLQAELAAVQKERDLLRRKLLHAQPVAEGPSLATASGAGTEGAGEEEEEAGAAAATAAASGATGEGETQEEDAEGAEAAEVAQELGGGFMKLLTHVDQEDYTSGGQREGDLSSGEIARLYFPGTPKPEPTVSPEPLTVQLPASFTYSYSSPLFPFPGAPTPSPDTSPPAATFTAGAPFQTSRQWGPSDFSLRSDVGAQGIDPQDPQRDRRDSYPHQQRKPVFRRLGDWDCPWCKAVNFSRRETCFRCGRRISLQSPQ